MALTTVDDFLDEKDNDLPEENRFPELGNGRYKLKALLHEWAAYDNVGTFIARVEVLEATPADGLREWKGEEFPTSKVGDIRVIKKWGFGKSDRHKGAVGMLKSYLNALLAHKDIRNKKGFDYMKAARQLISNKDDERVRALYEGQTFDVICTVMAPVSAGGDAKPWRKYSFI